MFTIMFVCTGNTCRSPMAEGIARTFDLPGMVFVSAGTWTQTGSPASPDAVLVAAEVGADLSQHRAHDLAWLEAVGPDEILAMEAHHVEALLAQRPDWSDRVRLLDPGAEAIADPYGLGVDQYRKARDRIIETLAEHRERWRP